MSLLIFWFREDGSVVLNSFGWSDWWCLQDQEVFSVAFFIIIHSIIQLRLAKLAFVLWGLMGSLFNGSNFQGLIEIPLIWFWHLLLLLNNWMSWILEVLNKCVEKVMGFMSWYYVDFFVFSFFSVRSTQFFYFTGFWWSLLLYYLHTY